MQGLFYLRARFCDNFGDGTDEYDKRISEEETH